MKDREKLVEEHKDLLLDLLEQYRTVRKLQLTAESFGNHDVRDKYIAEEAKILISIIGTMFLLGRDA